MKKKAKSNRKAYVHYGCEEFDYENLANSDKKPILKTKPNGLWASPLYCGTSWKEWCEREQFHTERLKKSFRFRLKKNAKVLHLYTLDDAAEYYVVKKEPSLSDRNYYYMEHSLDIEKIYAHFDAMEVHMSNDRARFHNNSVFNYYDVDSICIWNPDIVVPLPRKESTSC